LEHATLSGAVDDLTHRGFTEHFGVIGKKLRAIESGRTFVARDVLIREYQRFEGISDPDDMAIVYAIESQSGTRGTLVDAFGAYANPAVGAFLEDVPIRWTGWSKDDPIGSSTGGVSASEETRP
jgi:hypothetical protein